MTLQNYTNVNCEDCHSKIPNDAENNYGIGYLSGNLMRCWNCCSKRLKKNV